MRKLLLALIAAASLSCAVSAQNGQPNGGGNGVPNAVSCSGLSGSAGVSAGCTGSSTGQGAANNLSMTYVLCHGTSVSAHTGDTTETVLATCTIPANALGTNGLLRITTTWEHTNSANNKTVRVRFGGIGGTVYQAVVDTATVVARLQCDIFNVGATNSQKGGPAGGFAGGFAATAQAMVTSSVDTTAPVSLVLTGQLALGTENIQIDHYLVELITNAGT